MAETKWTPGPWVAEKHRTKYPDLFTYSILQARQHDGEPHRYGIVGDIDCAHNAALIAAAPELYEALADAKATLEEAAKLLVEHYPSVANNIVNQCAVRCGDALAKARGE